MWLGLGLIPLGYDVFDVLPTPHFLDGRMPDAALLTGVYAALSYLVFQAAVRPKVTVHEDPWTLTVVGPAFTTEVSLDAVDAIRIQPGPLIVAAHGKDIPVYCLMSPNIPVPRFWSHHHERLKDYVTLLKHSRPTSPSTAIAGTRRRPTRPHPAQLTMLAIHITYLTYGAWATQT